MAYFNELPLIEYPLRFENQSSNEDYTQVRNIFRRAKIRGDFANAATAFNYYQIKDDERPDQIAEKFYGDPELDWVVLITNNIISYPSEWTLSNNSLYDYLIDKYGDEDTLNDTRYIETNEVRDEFDRIVLPGKLQIEDDKYQDFKTTEKENYPLYYDLKSYPIPNKYKPLEITTNLGQHIQIWERGNLEEGEIYTGEEYKSDGIYLQKITEETNYDIDGNTFPPYSRLDYSFINVYDRNGEPTNIFSPITLDGWPSKWGGELYIFYRNDERDKFLLNPNLDVPVDITNDSRLYAISKLSSIDTFTYTEGTSILEEANQTYTISSPNSEPNDGINSKFEIKRNSLGEIILVNLLDEGINYKENEKITINGSQIGGIDKIDDIEITVSSVKPRPQFRFFSIGDELNNPYPGMKITIFNEAGYSYLNTYGTKVDIFDNKNEVSNYEYEVDLNENYRSILILKPQYLGVFIDEFKNIMSYDKSSETINSKLKRVYNPKITGG